MHRGPIAFYTPSLSTGGIGKMRMHLARAMIDLGQNVDLIVSNPSSPLMNLLPEGVRVFTIPTTHAFWSIFFLMRYIGRQGPVAIFTDRIRLNRATLRAVKWSGSSARVCLSFHNPISIKLATMPALRRRRLLKTVVELASRNSALIAVSSGVAMDLMTSLDVPRDRIKVIYNPVITPELFESAKVECDHPFFHVGAKVVITAGRMTEQKDFSTLLKAIALARKSIDCKLLVLGAKGKQFNRLMEQSKELGIESHVDFLGFKENPYCYFSRSDVFVLSSRWEGFGNVLVEALALGVPVVSTDCPVGPREILKDGRLGRLVPVGDYEGLANALLDTFIEGKLVAPVHDSSLKRFTAIESAKRYLECAGITLPRDANLNG